MDSTRVYLLTNKQYFRRFTFLGLVGSSVFLSVLLMKGYVADRESKFRTEYAHLNADPNFFHI